MVQVLPAVQGFGEKLANVLGQAGTDVFQGYQQYRSNQKDQEIINSFDPNASPIEQIKKFSQLSPQKQAAVTPLLQQYLKTQGTQQVAQQKQQQETEGLKNALDFLDQNIEYTGATFIPGTKSFGAANRPFTMNREGLQKREEFDTTGFWAADQVFTHFNKGTVSKEKLKVIQKDLAPRADLSERKNKARIDALRRMANLPADISPEKFNKILEKEVKSANKGEKESSKPSLEEIFK